MRQLLLVVAALTLPAAPAQAADVVGLGASPRLVRYEGQTSLVGTVAPAVAGEPVTILEGAKPIWSGVTEVDGSFAARVTVRRAARYVAVAGTGRSAPVLVRVRPRLRFGVRGPRVIGGRLRVIGRVLPHQAGRIAVRAGGRTYRARVGRSGRFRLTLSAPGPARARIEVVVRPPAATCASRAGCRSA